ncbi:EcsC family protein [Paenibacillus sp. CMAA1739]|uniref:EcsC family protein n=1 Tax=Paenibacillus ottowii TaxID=2315729 RepID=UPI002DBBD84D|nr:EcsC family protein [Paenibacillus sp. CMAA1739]MEC4567239.1 EcsC family protein [Paenibacillus sp. CMAA1739]
MKPLIEYRESQEILHQELKQIEKWEKEQKDIFFWEKIGRWPFMLLDRLTPKIIKDKLEQLLNELGSFIQNGGKYLVKEETILSRLNKTAREYMIKQNGIDSVLDTEDQPRVGENAVAEHYDDSVWDLKQVAELPLTIMDQTADDITSGRITFATAQGATTGIGGVFTIAADIPILLGLSLKVLQEIALCYGFNPQDKQERIFIIKCMQFASSDIVGKKAVLEELALFDDPSRQAQVFSQMQGWREVINTYRDQFGWKKLLQMVPIAGILFGSMANRSAISDVAEAGKMLYRKRRILKRLSEVENGLE